MKLDFFGIKVALTEVYSAYLATHRVIIGGEFFKKMMNFVLIENTLKDNKINLLGFDRI
jgi:hypothetical protein